MGLFHKKKSKIATPLRGKYLIQNTLARFILQLFDRTFSLFLGRGKKNFGISNPQKIVISNLAHLGDVILMTSVLPVLKQNLPGVKIGVVVGSWAKPLVENHPLVDFVHWVDHWKLSREKVSLGKKYLTYRKTFRKALQEIKKVNYEVALISNYHFPNATPLFYWAKVPVRIGYVSGGFGFLLTHPHRWTLKNQSTAAYTLELLKDLNLEKLEGLKPIAPAFSPFEKPDSSYIVIHMGSGNSVKEWPLSSWIRLCKKLDQEGYVLIFTGKGQREKLLAETVHSKLKRSKNWADKLDWEQYLSLLQKASLLISVDTVAGHAASYFETPSLLIYTGIHSFAHWKPLNPKAVLLSYPVPCAPCFKGKGCMSMQCIRKISWKKVYSEVKKVLEPQEGLLVQNYLEIS